MKRIPTSAYLNTPRVIIGFLVLFTLVVLATIHYAVEQQNLLKP